MQAFPAFGALRAAFPDGHLALVTDAALADLARATALFDEVIVFDAAVAFAGGLIDRLRLAAGLALTLRRFGPDDVAIFKGSPVYAALAAVSGATRRVGLARGAGAAWLTTALPIDPRRHHEDRFFDVVAALGADPARCVDAEWPARASLIPVAVRAGAWPVIGIAPGGARNAKQDVATKRWPAARFAELACDLWRAHPRAVFVLLGGPGDRGEVDIVADALHGADVVDLGGRTDVPTARATIADVDVYVGNDSGLMHVAATTRTPAVIAFGPTDPRAIAPRAERVRAIWDPVANPPCYDDVTGEQRPCGIPCCIDRVQVEVMRRAVEVALTESCRA